MRRTVGESWGHRRDGLNKKRREQGRLEREGRGAQTGRARKKGSEEPAVGGEGARLSDFPRRRGQRRAGRQDEVRGSARETGGSPSRRGPAALAERNVCHTPRSAREQVQVPGTVGEAPVPCTRRGAGARPSPPGLGRKTA